ncbi:uncharacterized protein LOC144905722 [Branchiostoma floridae x Branchiostoma belcheri]
MTLISNGVRLIQFTLQRNDQKCTFRIALKLHNADLTGCQGAHFRLLTFDMPFTLCMMAPGFHSSASFLVLLGCLFIVPESGAQSPVVTVTNSGNVQVFRTDTANLSCSFVSTVPLTVHSVSWYKLNNDGTEGAPFLIRVSNTINEDPDRLARLGLTGRVSFLPDLTSITIQETAQPDTGTFRCEVDPIFPGGGVAASVDTNLTVFAVGYCKREAVETKAGQVTFPRTDGGSFSYSAERCNSSAENEKPLASRFCRITTDRTAVWDQPVLLMCGTDLQNLSQVRIYTKLSQVRIYTNLSQVRVYTKV